MPSVSGPAAFRGPKRILFTLNLVQIDGRLFYRFGGIRTIKFSKVAALLQIT